MKPTIDVALALTVIQKLTDEGKKTLITELVKWFPGWIWAEMKRQGHIDYDKLNDWSEKIPP